MGRKVNNAYCKLPDGSSMTLEVTSNGIYSVEIVFDAEYFEVMQRYSWCFEQSKGQVYCMDLSMDLPTKMNYNTPRIYLKDLLMYLAGKLHTHTWHRKSLEDYRMKATDIRPIRSLTTK